MGWTNNIMFKLQSGALHGMKLSEDQVSWSASFMAIGAMLVCIPTGILLDTIGRKPTVLLASIPFYIGWACIIFAKFPAMLYAGRFFCGFAGASFCVSAPLYTSEIAERDIRGRLGAFFQLFYTLGSSMQCSSVGVSHYPVQLRLRHRTPSLCLPLPATARITS
nr:unnamed protein product [Callosobruchus analis]